MAADAADATVASEDGTPAPSPTHATGHALQTGWRDAVLAVAAHYQLNASPEHIRVAAQWNERAPVEDQAREMARQAGLSLHLVQPRLADLNPWRLPVALQLDGGQVAVVTAASEGRLTLVMSGDGGATITRGVEELQPYVQMLAVLRPLQSARDVRVDDYIAPVEDDWLRSLVLVDWRPYAHILVASLVIQLIALGTPLCSQVIIDKVIGHQTTSTLVVIASALATVIPTRVRVKRAWSTRLSPISE